MSERRHTSLSKVHIPSPKIKRCWSRQKIDWWNFVCGILNILIIEIHSKLVLLQVRLAFKIKEIDVRG